MQFHQILQVINFLVILIESPDDDCKLYCRVKNSNAYYLLKEKVIDGTKCGLNRYDICVNGLCRSGGCDNKLDSKVTLDECGVCGGDNSKCEEISGIYNKRAYGYNKVVQIPKGSSNIEILQRGYQGIRNDDNYLALVDGETGEYILNGNNSVSTFLKDIHFGGVKITYSGSEVDVENITSPKNTKISKDLIVEVLSVGKVRPPNITYKYTIQKDRAPRYFVIALTTNYFFTVISNFFFKIRMDPIRQSKLDQMQFNLQRYTIQETVLYRPPIK